ncbi:MAG: alpha-isopropylmalate synthase regulatory domain-containing protein [Carboxydocellales bacterium]
MTPYGLDYFHITSGSTMLPTGTVRLSKDDQFFEEAACGDDPVDAIYKAIDKITGWQGTLAQYSINAVTGGKDALGEVVVRLKDQQGHPFIGRRLSTDVLEASARAYIDAGNKLEFEASQGHNNGNDRFGV